MDGQRFKMANGSYFWYGTIRSLKIVKENIIFIAMVRFTLLNIQTEIFLKHGKGGIDDGMDGRLTVTNNRQGK